MSRSKIGSIVHLTCPKCRKGEMFTRPGLFQFIKPLSMHESCEYCGQKFEIEPGFWYGALWMSYPLVVLVELPFLLMALFSTFGSPWIAFEMMCVAFLICWPLFMRLGRSIWIHVWVRYDSE